MSLRHGIGKPFVECECDYGFTCGYCLRNAPPPIFTPSTVEEQIARDTARAALGDV